MSTQTQGTAGNLMADVMAALRRNWGWFLGVGIASIVLGIVAIGAPLAAGLAIEMLIGSILVVAGILRFVHAMKSRPNQSWIAELIVSIVSMAAGVLLLLFPLQGLLTITFILAAYLMVSGAFRVMIAVQMRRMIHWGWMIASGIVALLLGLLIWAHFPSDAGWILGLFVGIDLIFGGWALMMFSLKIKNLG